MDTEQRRALKTVEFLEKAARLKREHNAAKHYGEQHVVEYEEGAKEQRKRYEQKYGK